MVVLISAVFLIAICFYSEIKLRIKLRNILDNIIRIQKTVEYEYLDTEHKGNLDYMKDLIIWYLRVRHIELFASRFKSWGEVKAEERKIFGLYKIQNSDEYFKYINRKLIEAPFNVAKCRESV